MVPFADLDVVVLAREVDAVSAGAIGTIVDVRVEDVYLVDVSGLHGYRGHPFPIITASAADLLAFSETSSLNREYRVRLEVVPMPETSIPDPEDFLEAMLKVAPHMGPVTWMYDDPVAVGVTVAGPATSFEEACRRARSAVKEAVSLLGQEDVIVFATHVEIAD